VAGRHPAAGRFRGRMQPLLSLLNAFSRHGRFVISTSATAAPRYTECRGLVTV
jgi:hypothetical protein